MASVLEGVPALQNVNVQPALSNFAGVQDQQARLSQMAQQMDLQKQAAQEARSEKAMGYIGNAAHLAKTPEEYSAAINAVADQFPDIGNQLRPLADPSHWNEVKARTGNYVQEAQLSLQKQLLDKPQIEHSVDPLTGETTFYGIRPVSGTVRTLSPGGGPGGPQSAGGGATPDAAPAQPTQTPSASPSGTAPASTGDTDQNAMLGRLPPAVAPMVKGLISYDVDPNKLPIKARAGLLAAAQQIDPTYSASNYPARASMIKDATSGKMAAANNSLNTGIGHLDQLVDAVAGLGNGNFTPGNAAKNAIKTMTGDPAVTNFKAVSDRVAPEITRIWRGVGGSEADISRDLATLSDASSPQQLYGAIGNIAKMMQSKIDSNQFQYDQAVPGRKITMIRPEAEAVIAKLERLASGGGEPDQRFSTYFDGNKTADATPQAGALEAEMRRRGLLK